MTQLATELTRAADRLVERPHTVEVLTSFLDTATTSFGRATHYNTRADQQLAELAAHSAALALDRDLYAGLLTLPGVTDRSIQLGIRHLLATGGQAVADRALTAPAERELIRLLANQLPITRALKLIDSFRIAGDGDGIRRINNARTRKLILGLILGSAKLELWAIRYRTKLRRALTHAWGRRLASIIRTIAARPHDQRSNRDRAILSARVTAHTAIPAERAIECVAFILRAPRAEWTLPLLVARAAAKTDLAAGAGLPVEVLEGLRATYHPTVASATVLAAGAAGSGLTHGQRLAVQRRAADHAIEVEVDLTQYDAVRLYLYAYAVGMTDDVARILDDRARDAADKLPFAYRRTAILVDTSGSMAGSAEQPNRPIAAALALRDALCAASDEALIVYSSGQPHGRLVRPAGDTSLARGLVRLCAESPDAVFVLSDGYENRPAGRFAEVVDHLRDIGVDVPIYHLNPVLAAEAKGVRTLADRTVATIPVSRPDAFAASAIREMLATDLRLGLRKLIELIRIPEAVT